MAETNLPDDHHFARQCTGKSGKNFSDENDDYHSPPWLHGSAFQPSLKNPDISGLWIERVAASWDDQLERVKNELKNSKRSIKSTYQLAIIKVDAIKKIGTKFSRDLHVLHTPDDAAGLPSHSEIRGIQPEDEAMQQKLADTAFIEPIYAAT
jgi:hypothetical protein